MSLAVVRSRALAGMDAPEVTVEVHLGNGLPAFNLVGLPDTEVKEARDRVRAAIQTANFSFPQIRVTVNLAPADLPKESGRFDLAIAIGILVASGQVQAPALAEYEFAGELSLTGDLRPVRGALAMAVHTGRAGRSLVLPAENAPEAALTEGTAVIAARSLLEVCAHLGGQAPLAPYAGAPATALPEYPDLLDVKGQSQAKRALEVAAAGAHSLLMYGAPGTGKTMLAQRLAGIIPPLTEAAALEAAAIQSLAGRFRVEDWKKIPVRAPHHSASTAALVGGGGIPRPGEISLAHQGLIFLDELPEFDRRVLEALREPMESGHITVSRAARQAEFPARFQLVAAMNPCPCGYHGHPSGRCRCTPDQIARYRGKLSGPLLDRIDMTLEVPVPSDAELQGPPTGDNSATVRTRVIAARARQLDRQGKPNAALAPPEVDLHCQPDAAGSLLLKNAMARLNLSARAYHRILKVARTVADLSGARAIAAPHLAEAIHYRRPITEH